MRSENPRSGEHQQERLSPLWILGFTDGEGCFSVSVIKNNSLKFGYQIFPEFVLTQGLKSRKALEKVQDFFECGKIYENKRSDNHRENLCRYCVRDKTELLTKIIPFFEKYRLETAKLNDFEIFRQILVLMKDKKHLEKEGFDYAVRLANTMNRQKVRTTESSTTTRQRL